MFTINVFMTVIDEFKQLNLFVFELLFYVIGDMLVKSVGTNCIRYSNHAGRGQAQYLISYVRAV